MGKRLVPSWLALALYLPINYHSVSCFSPASGTPLTPAPPPCKIPSGSERLSHALHAAFPRSFQGALGVF